ncbi:hypothetical protein [Vibrio alginolyticus]|uniref:hypothetical protein n=1 Tax=Vibrio alginolyticus TaxID=663 RepID=UPI003755192A
MTFKTEWLFWLLPLAVGYGVLQQQVTEGAEVQDKLAAKVETITSIQQEQQVDLTRIKSNVDQHDKEIESMRPIYIDLQKTLASLDKTLGKQQVKMSTIEDDIKEIKQAIVRD